MSPHNKRALLVMAGGKGTRLWPESTSKTPKQYLKLIDDKSLLTQTLERFDNLVSRDSRFVITTKDQKGQASLHSKDLISQKEDQHGLIFEPQGRNTAPCILLGLSYLSAKGFSDDTVVSIVPSDHVILNTKAYVETMEKAFKYADQTQSIITLGIHPHYPHTGYGYIEKKDQLDDDFYRVSAFKEKPDLETAKKYLQSGHYFWNAGMFVASIKVLVEEMKKHCPELAKNFEKFKKLYQEGASEEDISKVYQQLEKISIDYAVMENSQNIKVLGARFDWNDLGSWDAMESVLKGDHKNTVIAAKGQQLIDSQGNIIYAPSKDVAIRGINDMVIVCNDDVLMLIPKKDSQKVADFVSEIKKKNPDSPLI